MTQSLIRRALSGDETALESLFHQHYPPALRLALGLLDNKGDAEEVAQDTLTYVLTHLDRYDAERGAFSTWLYAITVNRCRSKRRRKWLPLVGLTHWLEQKGHGSSFIHEPGPGPEEQLERDERDAALWAAVARLSAKQREAIVLRYAAGLTYPQMAEVLGCSASLAQSRTWLGERKLREMLADLIPGAATGAGAKNKHGMETVK
jgi:RNA polymerase sigma-70 factor (ECF subfamily)